MISDSIMHLMRGQVYEIDGHKIFTMGGASSHDKQFRTPGVTWWASELPSPDEYEEARANLKAHGNSVEFIFTHCAGEKIQNQLKPHYVKDDLTTFFDQLEEIDYQHWYFGHYHMDKEVDEKHTVLYNKIIRLW
jgi:hypothetical protein